MKSSDLTLAAIRLIACAALASFGCGGAQERECARAATGSAQPVPSSSAPATIHAQAEAPSGPWPPSPSITLSVLPQRAYIERRGAMQLINFDFIVKNEARQPLSLAAIEVSVFDKKEQLVLRKFINGNGFNPGINTVPKLDLDSGESMVVFNPFFAFEADVDLRELRYAFTFESKDGERELVVETSVTPVPYEPKTVLSLPVRGRLLVHDGHDFYSHHRRVDVTHVAAKKFGITSNFGRYAYDLCTVDARGALYRGKGEINEEWHAFGQPVLAPGDGKVVSSVDRFADNTHGAPPNFKPEDLLSNPMSLWGNYLVLDHGNGEHSMLAHLKRGSVKVKEGETVKRGDTIAAMGASGDASMPHLHYELRQGKTLNVEGFPSYFTGFRRLLGSTAVEVKLGQIDSGDIVESL